jgi:hypothetical protein
MRTFLIGLALIATVIYLLYSSKGHQQQQQHTQLSYLNVDATTNAVVNRSQQSQGVVDRLPLVEENTSIVPANEIVAMNYKGCQLNNENELYTNDALLFHEKAAPLVPLDVNAGQRRINYTFEKVSQNTLL